MFWFPSLTLLATPLFVFVFTLVNYQINLPSENSSDRSLEAGCLETSKNSSKGVNPSHGMSGCRPIAKLSSTGTCSTYAPSPTTSTWPSVHSSWSLRLFTTDHRAIDYVLEHLNEFTKPADIKASLELLGEGTYSIPIVESGAFPPRSRLLRVKKIASR